MSKPLLDVLGGQSRQPAPVWLMRQAGRYLPEYRAVRRQAGSFLDLCYTPELAIEVTLQPVERFRLDAAILFSDILVVPDGLGQQVGFEEGVGPVLEPVRSAAAIARLTTERLAERLAPVYVAVAGVAARLAAEVTLIGFAGSPWTVASYMVEGGSSKDFHSLKRMCYGEPTLFQRLIDILVDATVMHLVRQVEAGAEAVQLFESHAGILPPDAFKRWVIEPNGRIVARLRALWPGLPIIGFPRGAGALYPAFVSGTGVSGVSLDTTVPLDWVTKALPVKFPVQGNLDPVLLLVGGEPMREGIRRILQQVGDRPHIFNLGHGVDKDTNPETIAELVDKVRYCA